MALFAFLLFLSSLTILFAAQALGGKKGFILAFVYFGVQAYAVYTYAAYQFAAAA